MSNLDVKRTFLETLPAQELPSEFLEQVRRFKIRGSSGKLNIALDCLPHFPAIPQGSPCTRRDMHVTVPQARTVQPQPGIVVHRTRHMPWAGGALRAVDEEEAVLGLVAEATTDDELVGLVCEVGGM